MAFTKCWECSTVWACSRWHGDSPKYTLGSVCTLTYVCSVSIKKYNRDFPGSPVVKTSSSRAERAGSIPDGEAKIPNVSRPKHQNINQKQYCQNGLQKVCFCHGSDDLLYLLNLFVPFFFLMSKVRWVHEPNYPKVLLHELMGLERFWIASSVRNNSNECLNILESENVSCSVISDSSQPHRQ